MKQKISSFLKNKKIRIMLIASLPVVAGVGAWLIMSALEPTANTPNSSAQNSTDTIKLKAALTVIDGVAEVKVNDSWQPLKQGDTVETGQSIRTSLGARAVVTTDDGNAFRLNENSELNLTDLAANTIKITTVKGEVYSRVSGSDRTVTTTINDTAISTKGAAYRSVNTDQKQGVEVYSKTVSIDSKTTVKEGESYISTEAESATVRPLALEALSSDAFLTWNIELDKKDETYKKELGVLGNLPAPKPAEESTTPTSPTGTFTLSGERVEKGIRLTWSPNGISTANGFKLLYSTTNANPTFGVDASVYISTANARSWVVDLRDGKSYYLRVCAYQPSSGSCAPYTNSVKVVAPGSAASSELIPGPISVSVSGTSLNWTVGGTAPRGFKVVMSQTGTPSYPEHSKAYLEDSATRSIDLSKWELDAGTYNLRICKYTGESCVDYSNQVTVTLP